MRGSSRQMMMFDDKYIHISKIAHQCESIVFGWQSLENVSWGQWSCCMETNIQLFLVTANLSNGREMS